MTPHIPEHLAQATYSSGTETVSSHLMHLMVGEQGNPLQNRQFPLPMNALEWAGWLNPVIPGYTVRDKPCRHCRVLHKPGSEHHLTFKRQEGFLKDSHPD